MYSHLPSSSLPVLILSCSVHHPLSLFPILSFPVLILSCSVHHPLSLFPILSLPVLILSCSVHHPLSLFPILSFPVPTLFFLSSHSLFFSHLYVSAISSFHFPLLSLSVPTHLFPVPTCSLPEPTPFSPSFHPILFQFLLFYSTSHLVTQFLPSTPPPHYFLVLPVRSPFKTSTLLSISSATHYNMYHHYHPFLSQFANLFLPVFNLFFPVPTPSLPFPILCSHSFTQLPSPFIQVSCHFLHVFTSSLDANTFLLYCFLRNSLDVPETNALVFANQVCRSAAVCIHDYCLCC